MAKSKRVKEKIKPEIKKDSSLKGIEGWLLFIVIILGLGLVFQIPWTIYTSISDFSVLFLVYSLFSIALTTTLLVLIFNKRKSSIGKIIFILWLGTILELIVGLIQTINYSPTPELSKALMVASFIFGSIFEIAITILLVSYFKKSVRVKNTFVN